MKKTIWPWVKEIHERGYELWELTDVKTGRKVHGTHKREFIDYKVTNTWTGSVTIKRRYLNPRRIFRQ